MSHAETARLRLHATAAKLAGNEALPALVRDRATDVLVDGSDLEASAIGLLATVLAAEGEAKAVSLQLDALSAQRRRCAEAADLARTALADMLAETGMPAIRTGTHTASLREGQRAVVVTDAAALPARFLRQPPPEPDKAALREALAAGEAVPGAALANGAPILSVTLSKRNPR